VLEEFRDLLCILKLPVRAQKPDSTVSSDLRNLSVSRATVYVVGAHPPQQPVTQAFSTSIKAQRSLGRASLRARPYLPVLRVRCDCRLRKGMGWGGVFVTARNL